MRELVTERGKKTMDSAEMARMRLRGQRATGAWAPTKHSAYFSGQWPKSTDLARSVAAYWSARML